TIEGKQAAERYHPACARPSEEVTVKGYRTALLSAVVVCLALTAHARAADDEVPSFKKREGSEKEFAAKVGEATVKAIRTKPAKLEMEEYKITDPKANRKVLAIKMIWYGAVTGKKFTSDIKITIDPTEKDKWEVIDITYTDDDVSPKFGLDKNLKMLK